MKEMALNNPQNLQYTLRMLVLYFVLAFATTWGILIPALSSVPEDRQILLIILAAFGPFLSAVITIWTTKGKKEFRQRLRIPVSLYLAGAFFLPIGIGMPHYVLYKFLGGGSLILI